MRHRPLHVPDGARQRLGEVAAAQRHLVMAQAVAPDHLAAIRALVEPGVVELDAEAGDGGVGGLGGQRRHQARIDAAGELHRVADVALQMVAHRVADRLGRRLQCFLAADARVRRQAVERVVEATLAQVRVGEAEGGHGAAGQLLDAGEVAEPAGGEAEDDQLAQRHQVRFRRHETRQRPHLAGEGGERPPAHQVERLDAERIAGGDHLVLRPVQEDEGEHAFQPLDHRLAPEEVALQDDLGVAGGAERDPRLLQLASQPPEVVDLAVVDQRAAAAGVGHRLVRLGRRVEDRQPAQHQGRPGLAHDAAGIRAAVQDVPLHRLQKRPGEHPAVLEQGHESTHDDRSVKHVQEVRRQGRSSTRLGLGAPNRISPIG